MGKKMKAARGIIKAGGFVLPSPLEIEAAKSRGGAWTAATLARWGIAWPPKHGWRAELRRRWEGLHPEQAAELRSVESSLGSHDDLSEEYKAIIGGQPETLGSWGSKATGVSHANRALDSSHRTMVITDGMKADGTLRVLTGGDARKAWVQPIRAAS